MIFKNLFYKILAIIFSTCVIISGLLIFFKTYPDNFISTSADAVLYVSLKFYSQIKNAFSELIKDIRISREAQKKIDELNEEINNLREKNINYNEIQRENARLREYCDVKEKNPNMQFLSARVIGRVPGDSKGNFIIDVGKSDGISINDTVITEKGILGRISRVGPFSSNVKTILAPDVQISAIDSETGNIGLISGTPELAGKDLTRMTLIKYKDSVNISDTIITSGLSGIYPKNLSVGEVQSIEYDNTNSYYYAIIKPYNMMNEIKDVFVITNFSGKGIMDNWNIEIINFLNLN